MMVSHFSRNMHTSTDRDMLDEYATLLEPFARLSQCSDPSRIQWLLVCLPILPERRNVAIKCPQGKQEAQREIFFSQILKEDYALR